MNLLNKKPDLISDKARALNDQIAALESEIKKLGTQLQRPPEPKFRSTTMPAGMTVSSATGKSVSAPPPRPSEPVFEEVSRVNLAPPTEAAPPELFNGLGVRKYDLPALIARLRNRLRSPTTSNPRLINYLAVGSVQGLRPLRYEKRVARDRFIILVVIFLAILTGLSYLLLRH